MQSIVDRLAALFYLEVTSMSIKIQIVCVVNMLVTSVQIIRLHGLTRVMELLITHITMMITAVTV